MLILPYIPRLLGHILLTLLLLPTSLQAQSFLYPVKVDHKWGYIDRRGNVAVEPQYDVIAEEVLPYFQQGEKKIKSPFRLVELEGKLGLIGGQMQAVLEPQFNRIRPLSEQYFAVAEDSLFMAIDRAGVPCLSRPFREVLFLGTTDDQRHTYFMVREDALWGVQNAAGQQILPMQYHDIILLPVGAGSFKVKSDTSLNWGLINQQNEKILPEIFLDIKACTNNFFATQDPNTAWSAWDSLGRPHYSPQWLYFRKISPHFISMRDTLNRAYLHDLAQQDTLSYQGRGTRYGPLDDQYIVRYNGLQAGIADSSGTFVLDPTYQSIRSFPDSNLYLVQRNTWGLYDIAKNQEVLPCKYRRIDGFQTGYAQVLGTFGWGVINHKMEEIVPPRFDRIQREGKVFKAFRSQASTLYEVGDSGQVVNVEDYGMVKTLRVQKHGQGPTKEAEVINRRNEAQGDEYYMEKFPSPKVSIHTLLKWQFNHTQKRWVLQLDNARHSPPFYRYLRAFYAIDRPSLQLVAHRAYAVGGPFARIFGARSQGLSPLLLYSENRQSTMPTPIMIGLRRHDFERGLPNAAMIDAKGQFGLIDITGQQVMQQENEPLRFSYIGEFVNGYARVCVSGTLKPHENGDDGKITVEPITVLMNKFCITPMQGSRLNYTRLLLSEQEDQAPKWGVIDSTGKVVIEPQYNYLRNPSGSQLAAKIDGNWGVINLQNDTIIDFSYANITDYYGAWRILDRAKGVVYFNDRGWQVIDREYSQRGRLTNNRCRVQRDKLWGFVDGNGDLVIDCQYASANDFSEDIAVVKNEGNWYLMDIDGKRFQDLSHIQADTLGNFAGGLCWFKKDKKYGYLNTKGEIIIAPIYSRAFDFSCGVARVVSKGSTILIASNGQALTENGRYQRVGAFSSDSIAIATASVKAGKHALLHANGRQLSPMEYQEIGTFSEGFAPVRTQQLFGFINRQGNVVVPMKYERVRPFSHGLAAAMLPRMQKWIFIDTTGRQVIDKRFDVVRSAYDGQYIDVREFGHDPKSRRLINIKGESADVELGDVKFYQSNQLGIANYEVVGKTLYYYGNFKKEPLFDGLYDDIFPFNNGVAIVKKRGRKGVIDERGMMIVRPKYFYLEPQDDGLILAGPPAFGVANREGKILIDANYDSVELMSGNLYRVEQGEKVGYLDLRGRWVWRLQN